MLEDHPVRLIVSAVVLAVAVALGLGWFVQGNNFFLYKVFAPAQEQVRREVYEQTKSYKQGSVQRLSTLCDQVVSADDNHKTLLNAQIKQEFAEWNTGDVPDYLQACLNKARA
jgi:hypothetical protein